MSCSPWGCKESDMTKQLNNNNVKQNCVLQKDRYWRTAQKEIVRI